MVGVASSCIGIHVRPVLKIEHETEAPLMSMRDARILMAVSLFGTKDELKIRLEQMKTIPEI